jgi:5-methylcytosine-specific restriction endonuclease McrA
MGLSKKQRQQVWDKSGGLCWYCGCELPERGWHADHFEPVIREQTTARCHESGTWKFVPTGKVLRGEKDTLENMVPACAPCNLFKSTYDVEFFRSEIEAQIERVRKASSGFRIAERMGVIEAKPQDRVVFWFERRPTHDPD